MTNLVRSIITSLVPGSQLLSAALNSIGADSAERGAVVGIYPHLVASPIGMLLPPDLDSLIKVIIGGQGAVKSIAPALSGLLSAPGAQEFVVKHVDSILGSYPEINLVVSTLEKAAKAGAIPPVEEAESIGQYAVRLLGAAAQPVNEMDSVTSFSHTCPNCHFAHFVHVGEQ